MNKIEYFNEANAPLEDSRFDVVLYCQVGKSLDLAKFAVESAIANAGMANFMICFVCWGTSDETYEWLNDNHYWHVEIEDKREELGFVEQLYRGWNVGYDIAYKYSDYCLPIATDHYFGQDWMKNMYKWASKDRLVCCTLIEPGTLPTIHITKNLGITNHESFDYNGFNDIFNQVYQDAVFVDPYTGQFLSDHGIDMYGHKRQEAMPFICHKDIWEKYGPMSPAIESSGITGDTAFFDRIHAALDVDLCISRGSISYHCGGLETKRNETLEQS